MWPFRSDDKAAPGAPRPNTLSDPPLARPSDAPSPLGDSAPSGELPQTYPVAPRRQGRSALPLYIALFVVAVLAGSALFVSGYTLGNERAATPGTSATNQDAFAPFWDAYNKIRSDYVGEVTEKQLVEGALDGLFKALNDPYSSYMSSEEYKRSLSSLSGQFEGIGAEMTVHNERSEDEDCSPAGPTCRFVVVRTIPGSPAEKAGLKADDVVLAIDGTSVDGLTLDEAVTRVRGKKGTAVTLTIDREGADKPIDLTITRDVIRTQDVTSRVVADGTIGYLKIDGFSSESAPEFKKQLRELVDAKGLKKLILDLRDDPGGFVGEAQDIASQFIAEGPIFWEEYADGRKEPQNAKEGGVATDPSIELVVLVNGGSASASEIVAGALQDTGRARLVGEQTFGKGTVQQWNELRNDTGGFRLSIAKWLTPKQTWIHGKGITPDVVVERPDDTPADQDPQLERAIELLTSESTGLDWLPRAA
jgi:carboxyl-terminal processing protease